MRNRPIRVLFDAQRIFGNKTGVEYYTANLIENLAKQYPTELKLVGYHSGRQTGTPPVSDRNISYCHVWMPAKLINLLRRLHLPVPIELLTFQRADFVLYPNFLGLPSLARTPYAPVIHDLAFIDLPEYVSKRNLHDLRAFVPSQMKGSGFVITVSKFGKKRIHDEFHIPNEKILVTHIPPIKPTPFTKARQKAILDKLNIRSEYFLSLSTVEPRKNVLGMLDAYSLLPESLQKKYTLVIAGATGWNCDKELARLEQAAKEGKNIVRLNYVTAEQKAALYQGSVFYASASHYEGFGMTPLEAMTYGKACALSDIPVFREVALDAALYFDKDSPQSIATAWSKLLIDTGYRSRMAQKGKRQADSYHWSDVAESLYNRIVMTLQDPK